MTPGEADALLTIAEDLSSAVKDLSSAVKALHALVRAGLDSMKEDQANREVAERRRAFHVIA